MAMTTDDRFIHDLTDTMLIAEQAMLMLEAMTTKLDGERRREVLAVEMRVRDLHLAIIALLQRAEGLAREAPKTVSVDSATVQNNLIH